MSFRKINKKITHKDNTTSNLDYKRYLTVTGLTEIILLINSVQTLVDQHPALVEFLKSISKIVK